MNTPYEDIYELFYNRVINDKRFFLTGVMSIEEAEEIARERSKSLLLESIVYIQTYGTKDCEVNFIGDRDDLMEEFKFELSLVEKQLIADVMLQKYLEKDITIRLNALGQVFEDGDLKVFSPYNDIKYFNLALTELRTLNDTAIDRYKSRDRESFKHKNYIFNYDFD